MKTRAQIRLLDDGRRLHLHDGPIDLIVEAFGETDAIGLRTVQRQRRFVTVLDELCGELTFLRQAAQIGGRAPVGGHREADGGGGCALLRADFHHAHGGCGRRGRGGNPEHDDRGRQGFTGLRKQRRRHRAPSRARRALRRRHGRAAGSSIACSEPRRLDSAQPVRGIATSGWRGRSFSLGIADAVTVLADRAADGRRGRDHHRQRGRFAGTSQHRSRARSQLAPDSDLGDRLVTQEVGELSSAEIAAALDAGAIVARSLVADGLICSAALHLLGDTRTGSNLESAFIASLENRSLVHA